MLLYKSEQGDSPNLTLEEALEALERGELESFIIVWEKEDGFCCKVVAQHFSDGNAIFVIYDDNNEVIASASNADDDEQVLKVPFTIDGVREFAEIADEHAQMIR